MLVFGLLCTTDVDSKGNEPEGHCEEYYNAFIPSKLFVHGNNPSHLGMSGPDTNPDYSMLSSPCAVPSGTQPFQEAR